MSGSDLVSYLRQWGAAQDPAWSIREIGRRAGLGNSAINKWKAARPTRESLQAVARATGIDRTVLEYHLDRGKVDDGPLLTPEGQARLLARVSRLAPEDQALARRWFAGDDLGGFDEFVEWLRSREG